MRARVYGITNCDTVKAARAWLQQQAIDFEFHDFKKAGMPAVRLDAWLDAVGWEVLLNRKGTTWRRLDEAARLKAADRVGARELMLGQPGIVKRPVVEWQAGAAAGLAEISVGFDPTAWALRLATSG